MAALTAPPSVFAETAPPPAGAAPAPAPALPPVPAQPAGSIKIGLGWGLTEADVTAPGGLYVIGNGVMQAQLPAGQSVKVTLDPALKLAVTGLTAKFDTVRLVPVTPAPAPQTTTPVPGAAPPKPANPITYKAKTYRGEILIAVGPTSQKLSVINVVNLDEYLLGVVPEEVEATWPAESVKAQAVAARTYALANLGKRKGDGFDLVWTTGDQYYGGLASEKTLSDQAVMLTRGQVLTYGTKPINAFYHSSSGGYTESVEIILGGLPIDYLKGVKDYDNVQGNKLYSWQYTYNMDQLQALLKGQGYDVGSVSAVTAAGTTGVSGRPSHWLVKGATGTKTLTGEQLRKVLNIPSSPKTVTVQPGGMAPAVKSYSQAQTFVVLGAQGVLQQRTAAGTAVTAAGKATTVVAGAVTAMGAKMEQPGGIFVTGGGHGHAVGMSQWGAYGMALLGKKYDEILTHYYTSAKLETRQTQ